jgi:hypothetical protein
LRQLDGQDPQQILIYLNGLSVKRLGTLTQF